MPLTGGSTSQAIDMTASGSTMGRHDAHVTTLYWDVTAVGLDHGPRQRCIMMHLIWQAALPVRHGSQRLLASDAARGDHMASVHGLVVREASRATAASVQGLVVWCLWLLSQLVLGRRGIVAPRSASALLSRAAARRAGCLSWLRQ
jgi:hypothetical protein